MAGTKSSLIQFSALWLVLVCLRCVLGAYLAQAAPIKDGQQLSVQQLPKYPNLRRYYITDVDLNGHRVKAPTENWSVVRMDELLQSLNNEIPTPQPVLKLEPTVRIIKQVSTRAERLNVPYGIVEWDGRGQSQPTQIELVAAQADDPQTKEVVDQQTNSAGTSSINYQGSIKRIPIENSRWNNLRGMWGKRSAK